MHDEEEQTIMASRETPQPFANLTAQVTNVIAEPATITPAKRPKREEPDSFQKKRTRVGKVKGVILDEEVIFQWMRTEKYDRYCYDAPPAACTRMDATRKALRSNFDIKYTSRAAQKAVPRLTRSATIAGSLSSMEEVESTTHPSVSLVGGTSSRILLVEDMMSLKPGSKIDIMVSTTYQGSCDFSKRNTTARTFVSIGSIDYEMFGAEVVSNVYSLGDTFAIEDMKYDIFSNGNAGLCIKIVGGQSFELQFKSIFLDPSEIKIWAPIPQKRKFTPAFRRLTSNTSKSVLFDSLLSEVWGDRAMVLDLINSCEREHSQASEKVRKKTESKAKAYAELCGSGETAEFAKHVDSIFAAATDDSVGRFVAITDPLVSHAEMVEFHAMFRTKLPAHYECLAMRLGINTKLSSNTTMRREDRVMLFDFLGSLRKRSQKQLTNFACVNTVAFFSTPGALTASLLSGISATKPTLMNKTSDLRSSKHVLDRAREAVGSDPVTGAVMDNCQQSTDRKHQQHGESSVSVNGTARAYVEIDASESDLKSLELAFDDAHPREPESRVPITYIDQAIPSPKRFPKFESVDVASCSSVLEAISDPSSLLCTVGEESPDFTGKRVELYMSTLKTADLLVKMSDMIVGRVQSAAAKRAVRNLKKDLASAQQKARTFQSSTVLIWRPNAHSKCRFLLLPVILKDETSIRGAGEILLSMLEVNGFIVRTQVSDTVYRYEVPPSTSKRILILFGDGLTVMRLQQFQAKLKAVAADFTTAYQQAKVINKALKQVLVMRGDFHAGEFHQLQPIFDMFYPGFLDACQAALGWKKIKYSDVSQSYQLCKDLAELTFEECLTCVFENYIVSPQAVALLSASSDDENAAVKFALFFSIYLKEKQTSPDEPFRMMVNFVLAMQRFQLFRTSIRKGDSIAIESLYDEILPIWKCLGKNNYCEIGLTDVEKLYGEIPFALLEIARKNRTAALFDDAAGTKGAIHHAIDWVIEYINAKMKEMGFSNTEEGWTDHGNLMPLYCRARAFIRREFSRTEDASEAASSVVRKSRKSTKIPKRVAEKAAIMEMLKMTGCCLESTPGRELTPTLFWDVLPKLTVPLKVAGDSPACDQAIPTESMNVDSNEQDSYTILDCILGSENESTNAAIGVNEMAEECNDDNDDDAAVAQGGGHIGYRKIKIGTLGSTKKVFIRKLKEEALSDVVAIGKAKMTQEGIGEVRMRKKRRALRERKYLLDDLESFLNGESNKTSMSSIQEFQEPSELPTYTRKFRSRLQRRKES